MQFVVEEDVPEVVLSERRVLWCGLMNLLSNAMKCTYSGKIVTLASLIDDPEDPGKKMIRMSIADTGVGIDDGKRELLFRSPYCQLQQNPGGIGLGLYSASMSLTSLGGRCQHHHLKDFVDTCYPNGFYIDTEIYKSGSVFTMEVPFVPILNNSQNEETTIVQRGNEMPVTVLLIDDDTVTRKLMRRIITNVENLVVIIAEACNGAEALKIMKTSTFDVVFCDVPVVMPIMDGYECVKRLREFENEHRPEKRQYIHGLSGNVGVGYTKEASTGVSWILPASNLLRLRMLEAS